MKIIYVEDTNEKYMAVCGVMKSADLGVPVRKKNLEDVISEICSAKKNGEPYDIILTDMEYPQKDGGDPWPDAGEQLIRFLKEKDDGTPVIVISSVNYRGKIPAGSSTAIFYRQKDMMWQRELVATIKDIQKFENGLDRKRDNTKCEGKINGRMAYPQV